MAYAMERHCVLCAGNVKCLAEILAAQPAAFKPNYPNSATLLPVYLL
jgi:hypothetical protein